MASKYIQKFPTPEGFPEILSDLAKEVLRNQPSDILEFCALYFKCLQEGTELNYQNKGQNIPCDFKNSTPQITERIKRKKPLNEEDEALYDEAVEKSTRIAKKPMGPDPVLLADEKKDQEMKEALEKKKEMEEQKLLEDLKEKNSEREKSVKSAASRKAESHASGSNYFIFFILFNAFYLLKFLLNSLLAKSISKTSEQMREIKAVSTKFLEEVMDKQNNQEINREAEMHVKDNTNAPVMNNNDNNNENKENNENKPEEKAEEKPVENKSEEKVEEKSEVKVEEKAEEKVEEKVEEKAEEKVEENKPEEKAEEKVEEKPAEEKPAEEKPAEEKPVEEKPAEQ